MTTHWSNPIKPHSGVGTLEDALTNGAFRISNEVRVWVWVVLKPWKKRPKRSNLTNPEVG